MTNDANYLFNKIKQKQYTPQNICEIGVFKPEDSNLLGFINEDIRTTLVEADPIYVEQIHNYFINKTNIKVVPKAIFDFNGQIELCRHSASTFVKELKSSPALVNDNYKLETAETFVADCIKFSEIDKGDFDVISIDIEGAEWYVLKHMKSRPNILSIETHGKYYVNPNIEEIRNWIKENNYIQWYKGKSDTVFIKKNIFNVTILEKLKIILKNLSIFLIKQKKILKKFI